jgi:translocation and assembly module TamB
VDSLAGSVVVIGSAYGSIKALSVSGQVAGRNVFVRREAGKEIVGSFALADVFGEPSGTASLRFNALNIGGIVLDTLGGAVRLEAGRTGVFSFGSLAKNGVTLVAHGDVAIADNVTNIVVRDVALATDSSRWSLRGPSNIHTKGRGITIDSLVLVNGAGGRISLEGTVPDTGRARIFLRADSVSLHDVGSVVQSRAPFSGWAHVTAQGAGPALAPVMNMQAALTDVRYGGLRLDRVNATAEYIDKRAAVALDLARGGHMALVARGSLPLELKYFGARLLGDSLHGTIRTDSASFDIIEALVPGLRDATGRLVVNLDVAGTWKHPDLAGALRVENGEVTVDTLGIRMKGVNVDLTVFGHNDSLAIRRFVGWSGTSPADSVALKGYVAYRDIDNPYVDLTLQTRTFRALDKRSLARLDISTEPGGLRLRGRLHGATLRGGIVVDRGTIFLPDPELARKQVADLGVPFADTSGVVRQLPPDNSSHLFDSILIDGVRITLGDEVWLRSREANIKLAGSLSVQGSTRQSGAQPVDGGGGALTAKPTLDGVLRAERGTYTLALGPVLREFQVQEGTITFYPTPELKPELNITALHTVRTGNGQDLHIRVRLTGPLYPNPIVSLESAESFAMSHSEMVSYLIFGQPEFALGSADKSYVQLAAQTLFPSLQTFGASQLRGVLGSWVDFRFGSTDLTALSGGRSGTTTQGDALRQIFFNSRLGAEKQLNDNLFVSLSTGICQLSQSNPTGTTSQLEDFYNGLSGKFEYRLSRDASIKAGKEPSQLICGRSTTGRVAAAPTQWGFSLFKSWRF